MGLFDPIQERDYDLRDVMNQPLHILRAELRKTNTVYGATEAIDLFIDVNGDEKYVSGFSKGIVRQIKQSNRRDFPVWAEIREKPLGNGKTTTELYPCAEGPSQLPLVAQEGSDDDIPFSA